MRYYLHFVYCDCMRLCLCAAMLTCCCVVSQNFLCVQLAGLFPADMLKQEPIHGTTVKQNNTHRIVVEGIDMTVRSLARYSLTTQICCVGAEEFVDTCLYNRMWKMAENRVKQRNAHNIEIGKNLPPKRRFLVDQQTESLSSIKFRCFHLNLAGHVGIIDVGFGGGLSVK
jgi:hypothetical protein